MGWRDNTQDKARSRSKAEGKAKIFRGIGSAWAVWSNAMATDLSMSNAIVSVRTLRIRPVGYLASLVLGQDTRGRVPGGEFL